MFVARRVGGTGGERARVDAADSRPIYPVIWYYYINLYINIKEEKWVMANSDEWQTTVGPDC
jgi:hypothetical protein